jgi:hypothetical protein
MGLKTYILHSKNAWWNKKHGWNVLVKKKREFTIHPFYRHHEEDYKG